MTEPHTQGSPGLCAGFVGSSGSPNLLHPASEISAYDEIARLALRKGWRKKHADSIIGMYLESAENHLREYGRVLRYFGRELNMSVIDRDHAIRQ